MRLPPYSPNLQPIEGVFNQLKRNVRDIVYHDNRYMRKPVRLMAAATAMLTQEQISGQFVRISKNLTRLVLPPVVGVEQELEEEQEVEEEHHG